MRNLKIASVALMAMLSLVCLAAPAVADGWTQRETIDRISHRSDRIAIVYAEDGAWRNPDNCTDDSGVVLDPESLSSEAAYKEEFAMLLTAKITGGEVIVFVSGCHVLPDGRSLPVVLRLAIY